MLSNRNYLLYQPLNFITKYVNLRFIKVVSIFICLPFYLQGQYRINEFAYDCDISDNNEVVEVRIENTFIGSLSDLALTLYNGNDGSPYGVVETLDNFVVGTNDGVYTYYTWTPSSIMNGSPDGLSLDYQGTIVEFLSYEGTFTAVGGAADGSISTDIGVSQTNSSTCDRTLQIDNSGNWIEKLATNGEPNESTTATEITAIGTCTGISSADEDTYNIIISGLSETSNYHFDLDGDGVNEITNFTGATTFVTAVEDNTNIPFVDGTVNRLVQIDLEANGNYDVMINVHEVLCTDVDDDGNLDFDAGCDNDLPDEHKGYIVASVSPYIGTNIYVYVLTNSTNNALAANTSGLFTNLESGNNDTEIDYQVVAFNFSDATDASMYISGLTFSQIAGTIVTSSTMPAACSMACGSMAYDVECLSKKTIPTMNQWGLLIFGLLLLNLGLIFIKQLEGVR